MRPCWSPQSPSITVHTTTTTTPQKGLKKESISGPTGFFTVGWSYIVSRLDQVEHLCSSLQGPRVSAGKNINNIYTYRAQTITITITITKPRKRSVSIWVVFTWSTSKSRAECMEEKELRPWATTNHPSHLARQVHPSYASLSSTTREANDGDSG